MIFKFHSVTYKVKHQETPKNETFRKESKNEIFKKIFKNY